MTRRKQVSAARGVVASLVLALAVWLSPGLSMPAAAHEDSESGMPVFLVHGMPDAVFEVQVGADRRLKGLRFGQFYNLRAFAGTTLSFGFKILDTGEPVVATDGFAVPADRSSSLVVHHAADGSGALTAFENELDPLRPGMSRLIVRHLAAAAPVDVEVDGEPVLLGIEHGWEESIELPAGDISVSLVSSDRDDGTIGPVDVTLEPGDRTVVYAFGSADDESLAVVTDVVHGVDDAEGLPLRAMAASTALAAVIGVVGLDRIRRRSRHQTSGPSTG